MTEHNELPPGVTPQDVEGYRRVVARCWIVAGLLVELPVEQLNELGRRAETLGPILYPDVWRTKAKAIMEDREMLRALSAAKHDILTTSPSLKELGPLISTQVDAWQEQLESSFRAFVSRRPMSEIPPAVLLTALVRFIARLVPKKDDDR